MESEAPFWKLAGFLAFMAALGAIALLWGTAEHDHEGIFGQAPAAWGQALGTVAALMLSVWLAERERQARRVEREEGRTERLAERRRDQDELAEAANQVIDACNSYLGSFHLEIDGDGPVDLEVFVQRAKAWRLGLQHYLDRPLPNPLVLADILDCLSDLGAIETAIELSDLSPNYQELSRIRAAASVAVERIDKRIETLPRP